MIVFTIIALGLFITLGVIDFRQSKSINDLVSIQKQRTGILITVAIVSVSVTLVEYVFPVIWPSYGQLYQTKGLLIAFSILLSFLISYSWFIYLSWLDVFEKERILHILVVFIMASASTFLVIPISALLRGFTGGLNGDFVNDLGYCIVNIGMVEELVKILPFLIMLRFSKAINESFDYILYGGVCALGFAFIENIQYLFRSELVAINGRSLFSSVAHMFDTSIICYCLALAHFRKKNPVPYFLSGFILAAIAHGFYDFWLISSSYRIPFFTFLFFMMSIHFFTRMKNNLINISQFFDPNVRLDSFSSKYQLFNLLIGILFLTYMAMGILRGSEYANEFLQNQLGFDLYILVFLAVSFGSINLVQGYLAPVVVSGRWLLPLINKHPNYLQSSFTLYRHKMGKKSQSHKVLAELLPLQGSFTKRIVVKGDFNWYHFSVNENDNKALKGQLIIKPANISSNMGQDKFHVVWVGYLKPETDTSQVSFARSEVHLMGHFLLRLSIFDGNMYGEGE